MSLPCLFHLLGLFLIFVMCFMCFCVFPLSFDYNVAACVFVHVFYVFLCFLLSVLILISQLVFFVLLCFLSSVTFSVASVFCVFSCLVQKQV